MTKKIKVDEESYVMLLNKILTNKEEERELALDRYRKVDEKMETNDHFVVMGKNAVSFLRLVSDTTNDMANLAKEIKSVIFKEEQKPVDPVKVNDDLMKKVIDKIKDSEENGDLSQDDKNSLSEE
jgi:RNA processing factor Prp31